MDHESDFLLKLTRRAMIWTFVCSVSALPSFLFAHHAFNRSAMLFGVALFIGIYTILSCTPAFERFYQRPHVRKTLYIGYWVRIGLSLAFPLGMAIDFAPGMVTYVFVEGLGLEPHTFGGTLAMTLIQGAILNFLLFLFMLLVYAVLRARGSHIPIQPRGFEVLIPEARIAEPTTPSPQAPSGSV